MQFSILSGTYSKIARFCVFPALCGLTQAARAAETAGQALPYEDWLHTLQQSLTGPVAFSVAMIGIVSCGATLIFAGGEIGRFMRALIYIVLVMTLLIGANSLMTRFFNGASIGEITPQIAALQAQAADPGCTPADLQLPCPGVGSYQKVPGLNEAVLMPRLQQLYLQQQLTVRV